MADNIANFEKLAFGLFVHFGLYSVIGRGEWHLKLNGGGDEAGYRKTAEKFRVKKNWAKELVRTAKRAGCRYITLTARHHDGFSLYDTRGLSDYDSVHAACGRDLIGEFVEACREGGIVPVLYHTFADWDRREYEEDFPAYVEYLHESVGLLCTRYGEIGGIWFDGMWEKPDADWREDELYGMIHRLQPGAVIVNNSGLNAQGKVRHPAIDCVTFERGKPFRLTETDRHRAGEMCQVLNEHWGYCARDINYKRPADLLADLVDCRAAGCNFLLNTGLTGNGGVRPYDGAMLGEIGKWIRIYGNIVYGVHGASFACEGGTALTDGKRYFVAVRDMTMDADPNVTLHKECASVRVLSAEKVRRAVWLDSGEEIPVSENRFVAKPFWYGTSLCVRVAEIFF